MSQELVTTEQSPQPFQRMLASQRGINAGAVAIEQERAIAEAQGQLTLAKRFPRSMTGAMTEFLESCKSSEFAATAFYSVPNRGSGPSIRFAEEAARCCGNFIYGHRELSRGDGKSEIEVFAWDMEKNNRSTRQITVMHTIDTKNGPKQCRDQAEIDNLIANKASKQMRGRILALLPKHIVAAGQAACKVTLAGGNTEKPMAERITGMVQRFGRFGVTVAHIEANLGHGIDHTTVDELADLTGIFNAIKDGGKASEYFPIGDSAAESTASTAAAITQQAKQQRRAPKAETTAAPAPAAAPAQESKPAESNSKPVESQDAGITQEPETSRPAQPQEDDVF